LIPKCILRLARKDRKNGTRFHAEGKQLPQLLFRKLPSLTESEKFLSHVSIQTGIAGQSSHKRFIGNTLKESRCDIQIAAPTGRKIPAVLRYSRGPLETSCAPRRVSLSEGAGWVPTT
jgi:hypothetical protein